jgi:predicted PurR-regulated permease PerM
VNPYPGRPPAKATGEAAALRTIATVAAICLVVWLLSDLVLVVFLAILIAVMLRGVSNWTSRRTGVNERLMLAIVSITWTAALLALLYYIGPKLLAQSQDLLGRLHQEIGTLRQTYGSTPWGRAIFSDLGSTEAMRGRLAHYAGSVVTTTLGGLATTFILIVTSLYLAISPELYIDGFVRLFPPRRRARTRAVVLDIGATLRWWSLGQLIDMTAVGVLSGIGLELLRVPLALALGVLAGLFTFVPYFGAIAAAIPAMVIAFTVSWQTSAWTLLIFAGCHAIEGYVLAPIVQRSTVELPPAVTILSMTILGAVFGPLGVILGTPVAAAALVAVREAYVEDVLGDTQSAARNDETPAPDEAVGTRGP